MASKTKLTAKNLSELETNKADKKADSDFYSPPDSPTAYEDTDETPTYEDADEQSFYTHFNSVNITKKNNNYTTNPLYNQPLTFIRINGKYKLVNRLYMIKSKNLNDILYNRLVTNDTTYQALIQQYKELDKN